MPAQKTKSTAAQARPHTGSPAPAIDVTGRPLEPRPVDLDAFFHPKSIAVIGASDIASKPNTLMTRTLNAWADAHGATFYPVHPTNETVFGKHVYRTIAEVPQVVDLVAILTGTAVDTFAEVQAAQAKFAVIFAAGFSEIGKDGEKLEARLRDLVAVGPTHLLGPNTNLNAFETFRDDLEPPSIALITQSGAQGRGIFQGQELGIAITHWAPTGNEVDLEFADFAKYFADQPEVGVVASYIEGFKDGRSLMLAADHAAALEKPIVIVKVGRTEEGRVMAKAHTGHLTGSDAVTSAVFRQFGVTRVDGLDELLEVSTAFARTKPPTTDGVCIYSVSGGTGAHMADMASAAGLRLPALGKETQRILHDGLIPSYLRVSNPVDCGGPPVGDARGMKILEAIVADPKIGAVIVPIPGAVEMFSVGLSRDLPLIAQQTDKPIFVVWGAPPGTDDTYYYKLLDGGLPVFRTFGNCVTATRAYFDYWGFARRHKSPFTDAPRTPLPAAKRARKLLDPAPRGSTLSEHTSKEIIKAYGIRTSRDELCTSAAEAVPRREAPRVPRCDETVGRRAVAQERPRLSEGRRELRQGRARSVRRPRPACPAGRREERRGRGHPRVRAGQRRSGDGGRCLPRRAVRPRGDGRSRRRLRGGAQGRHLPCAAVRPRRGEAHVAGAQGLPDAGRRARLEAG